MTQDFESVIQICDLENWKEALAMALTYAKAEEFTQLCGNLSVSFKGSHGSTNDQKFVF